MNDDIDYLDSDLSDPGAYRPKNDGCWIWFMIFAVILFLTLAAICRG